MSPETVCANLMDPTLMDVLYEPRLGFDTVRHLKLQRCFDGYKWKIINSTNTKHTQSVVFFYMMKKVLKIWNLNTITVLRSTLKRQQAGVRLKMNHFKRQNCVSLLWKKIQRQNTADDRGRILKRMTSVGGRQ